ncbi:MAG: hypothetical protein FWG10_03675 [Eubacteriaceae bacterium]|nr:hypothetical protein [Eubacteriaceae bacterium]
MERRTPGRIDKITGGVFASQRGLQVDRYCSVLEITGGDFNAETYGIYTVASSFIGEIGADANIQGSTGIENRGVIALIDGGTINGERYALRNAGTIDLISSGTFVGMIAIYNDSAQGDLKEISGGVFWSKSTDPNAVAINLSPQYPLALEPGLDTAIGVARFWVDSGNIFNSDAVVNYPPVTIPGIGGYYSMSPYTSTLPVDGITGVEFRYLMFDVPEGYHYVAVLDSCAKISGAGYYEESQLVNIYAGSCPGKAFTGWTTDDGIIINNPNNAAASFTMPDGDVTVRANWQCIPGITIGQTITQIIDCCRGAGAKPHLEC